MFFIEKFRVNLSMLNKSNLITNKSILTMLQDIAEMHSSSVGFGVTDLNTTHCSWALLNWKLEIFERPKYGDVITIKTWARYNTKLYCYRDFEILNSNGDVIGIATSKWVLFNISTGRIEKIEDELISKYNSEDKSVFNIVDLPKLNELEAYEFSKEYTIRKADIDINNHVNNLSYMDIATEVLPDNFIDNELNNIEIMYKKQIKLEDSIEVYYGVTENNENSVVIKNSDGSVHAIIKLF